ncbi:LysR family transcriptional regulator [Undibacterium parvum]|uniref:LysR family transcriptional regulator n=1 Tax=Undibacterium parvum TaxID=401471 RepID=A0A3S9HKE3_9BURK|nr:LysR family transcriptional regulator [Undibacterium parvum]AZP12579.1 LysR family transcriptional regulator [Undibacterium parvum]
MNLEANDLLLFARVVDEGSFSRAAERLGLPKSTLSRRISGLEAQLGERLLLRTTRKLSVTDFGQAVLLHAHQLTAEVESTIALAQHRQLEPSGRLRVSMPNDFANEVLGQMLADFILKYPAISLELDLSARRVDLIAENFDVAIRMGSLPDDATLAARRLAVFSTGLFAAPGYLSKRGMPYEPEALMEHDSLRILTRSGEPALWNLSRTPDGANAAEQSWQGSPPVRACVNSPDTLIHMARRGLGIVMTAEHFVAKYVAAGELQQVLGDWNMPSTSAWAVFPGRRLMPARTRVFLDALQEEFSEPRCQKIVAELAQKKIKK